MGGGARVGWVSLLASPPFDRKKFEFSLELKALALPSLWENPYLVYLKELVDNRVRSRWFNCCHLLVFPIDLLLPSLLLSLRLTLPPLRCLGLLDLATGLQKGLCTKWS